MLDLSPWDEGRTGKRREAGFVYFVQAQRLELVKIGIASNMSARLAALQCGSPDRLVVLGVEPHETPALLESELHTRFRKERQHGEWFNPSPALLSYVRENAMSLDSYAIYERDLQMAEWVKTGVIAPATDMPREDQYKGLSKKLARYKAARGLAPDA